MDQFRGYSVAGMFVVNFLAGLTVIPSILKHNNTHFSLADSVMPSFLFAAGFSYRLTMLRRSSPYGHAVRRSLALILISAVFFGLDGAFSSWEQMTAENVREYLASVLKARLWNVLAIIGAVQLLVLPVITASGWVRLAAMVVLMVGHGILSHSFNYEFVYGRPNWMDAWWGAAKTRAWDGGFFGLMMWAVPLLAGTLAYDVLQRPAPVRRLLAGGAILMVLGYGLSCLATRFDVDASGIKWAEPPFVTPPPAEERTPNYWMMDKRVVTVSFTLFATGFASALYGLFVLVCDRGGLESSLFRMLGQNPLVAYLLHYPIGKSIRALVPKDAPLWWCLVGFAVFFLITALFVAYLDRRKLYVRL